MRATSGAATKSPGSWYTTCAKGAHGRKVMASYQSWFGEGADLATLRLFGLFDLPVDKQAVGGLLKRPAIPGFTNPSPLN